MNPKSSKYILLDINKSPTCGVLPPGEHKGTLKSVESSDAGIVITTQNEDFLEMKVKYFNLCIVQFVTEIYLL